MAAGIHAQFIELTRQDGRGWVFSFVVGSIPTTYLTTDRLVQFVPFWTSQGGLEEKLVLKHIIMKQGWHCVFGGVLPTPDLTYPRLHDQTFPPFCGWAGGVEPTHLTDNPITLPQPYFGQLNKNVFGWCLCCLEEHLGKHWRIDIPIPQHTIPALTDTEWHTTFIWH